MAEADPQKTFNIHEAKTQFSRLVLRAHGGEEIIVAKDGKPYARLMPLANAAPTPRQPGRFRDLLKDVTAASVLASSFTGEELDSVESATLFPPFV